MSLDTNLEPWLFQVEPLEGESLSHFLGRFRRRNHLSCSALGDLTGLGGAINRWEKFRHNPFPSDAELTALGELTGVDSTRLRLMLPPQGETMKMEPIRLCGACCWESLYHGLEWQFQSIWKCEKHQLALLCKCPKCEKPFKRPSLWEFGHCDRCGLFFSAMTQYQKLA